MTTRGTTESGVRAPAIGVVLAGGRASRLGGGDKGLRALGGRPIVERIIERARPQVDALALNANGDPGRFTAYGLPVLVDSIDGFAGPLAGVLAGLDWAATAHPTIQWVASFPTDSPFFPTDLVDRLLSAVDRGQADIACARSGSRTHPVFGLWPVGIRATLRAALRGGGAYGVEAFMHNYRLAAVAFPIGDFDPFFNINTEQDLQIAEKRVTSSGN